jgi:serine/threonine protein kinase
LHRLCIIHRDLKPTNILLSSKDPMTQVVKVLPPLNNYYQKLRKLNYYRLLILAMQLLQGKQRGSISRSARSAIGLPRSSLKRATISPRMFGGFCLQNMQMTSCPSSPYRAAGVILYCLVCGKFPFHYKNDRELISRISKGR